MDALSAIRKAGFYVALNETETILISPVSKLTTQQRDYIKLHKPEIISCLKAANYEIHHRYVYRLEFKYGEGAGTWITSFAPDKAEKALLSRFPNKDFV